MLRSGGGASFDALEPRPDRRSGREPAGKPEGDLSLPVLNGYGSLRERNVVPCETAPLDAYQLPVPQTRIHPKHRTQKGIPLLGSIRCSGSIVAHRSIRKT